MQAHVRIIRGREEQGDKEGETHLRREGEGGAIRRGETGEDRVCGGRWNSADRRGGGGLHLRHPIDLIYLADSDVLFRLKRDSQHRRETDRDREKEKPE